jgi:probable HAF family extracellular repeat protein
MLVRPVLVREPPASRYTVTLVQPIAGLKDALFGVDVNGSGQVVGTVAAGFYSRAFRWHNGVTAIIDPEGIEHSVAFGINEAGQVAGSFDSWAYFWYGTMLDLGTLGGPAATAADINNRGQIVGFSMAADNSCHPVLWENGQITSIRSLIPAEFGVQLACSPYGTGVEGGPIGIGDGGHIVVAVHRPGTGESYFALLTPRP